LYTYEVEADGRLGRKNNQLTPWRIQKLYDIGFTFKTQFNWKDRYEQLRNVFEKEGNITSACMDAKGEWEEEFPGLYLWTFTQRTEYRKWKEGLPSRMNDDKFEQLNSLGFEWDPMQALWEKRRMQLQKYREEYGHIRVTRKQDRSLASFLIDQRKKYRLYQESPAASTLTEEKIKLLEDVGMEWDPLETRWQMKFDELELFSRDHGHCQVPVLYPENQSLGNWVLAQRSSKREGRLDREKEDQLLSIGFVFDVADHSFDQGMQKLREYKKKHGDCLVPRTYEDQSLVMFVCNQRNQYRRLLKNRQNSVTDERLQQLKEVGFVFRVESPWDDYYERLCQFRDVHGHANVPVNHTDTSLASFVYQQRNLYRLLKQGKKKTMTPEKIEKLERIGFAWNTNEARWMQRLGELKKFIAEHGHCNLPPNHRAFPQLGMWLWTQRRNYKRLQAGEKNTMTEQRIKLLEEAGIELSVPANRPKR